MTNFVCFYAAARRETNERFHIKQLRNSFLHSSCSVTRMASLTFYGGVAEIGGNKILLEDQDARLFLDFGMSFGVTKKFFAEYMKPRKCNGVLDLMEFGLLPNVDGLYRCDYLEHCYRSFEEEPSIHGILLSHAHMDHSAYIHYLRDDIPLYCTQASKDIMQSMDETGSSGTCEYVALRESFQTYKNKDGEDSRSKGAATEKPRTYNTSDSFRVGELGVESLSVSHSLEGAAAYILHSEAGSIVYTGDLRFHGYKGDLTREFVERAAEADAIALICEGTYISSTLNDSEEKVKKEAKEAVEKTDNLVIVNFPIRDTDRMLSFLQVAQQTDRALVINLKQAYLLELFKKSGISAPRIDDNNIRIYVPRKSWGIYKDDRFSEKIQREDFKKWEAQFLDHPNAVSTREIRENQADYIFRCDFYELTQLIDIKPELGSCYIRSICEPFDEDSELDEKKVRNWLTHFNLCPYKQIHASGHLSHEEIKNLIETVKPKVVFPIHTENPEMFFSLHDNVITPQLGVEYTL